MNINIIPLTEVMPPSHHCKAYYFYEYYCEFEKIFKDNTRFEPSLPDGMMFVIKGAAIQNWYADARKKRKWVRELDPNQAYAFGVDAFETEVG